MRTNHFLQIVLLSFIFVMCAGLTQAQSASSKGGGSSKYYAADGKFKINFPGSPTRTTQTVETAAGNVELVMYAYDASSAESYLASYGDYPQASIDAGTSDEQLKGAKDGFISSMKLNITKEKSITLDGVPGIYVEADNGSMYVSYKVFLKKNRLYQIMYGSTSAIPKSVIASFVDSFELTD
jgi:hypothetical protein